MCCHHSSTDGCRRNAILGTADRMNNGCGCHNNNLGGIVDDIYDEEPSCGCRQDQCGNVGGVSDCQSGGLLGCAACGIYRTVFRLVNGLDNTLSCGRRPCRRRCR